jgi:hypothetical protein
VALQKKKAYLDMKICYQYGMSHNLTYVLNGPKTYLPEQESDVWGNLTHPKGTTCPTRKDLVTHTEFKLHSFVDLLELEGSTSDRARQCEVVSTPSGDCWVVLEHSSCLHSGPSPESQTQL